MSTNKLPRSLARAERPVHSLRKIGQTPAYVSRAAALLLVLIAPVLVVPLLANAQVVPVDRVVAVVNDEVITQTEYRSRVAKAKERLLAARQPVPAQKELNEKVLEQIIIERAERQHAKLVGIKVNDEQVKAAIRNVAQNNKMTVSELNSQLRLEGVSREEFSKTIRSQIIRARLRESVVQSQISVSDADIDAFLSSNQPGANSIAKTEYNVEQIFLKIPESASESQVQERQAQAEQLLERLKSGEDFGTIEMWNTATSS